MVDISWLSAQARTLHDILIGLFYGIVTTLLLLGVLIEYFRWPLGGIPSFAVLVGRALVAAILLHTYPDVANTLATFSEEIASRLGNLNEFHQVLSAMGDKLGELSASWVSVKETLTVALSFLGFFILYFSVYVAEGIMLFTWTLCYVMSPVLIALFVLPATAGTTKALYRTLIEVSAWKVVWSILATLLWSTAMSDINQPGHDVNFISVVCLDLLLASSLLATPWIVHALASSGLAGFTRTLGAIAVGTATITPARVIGGTARRVESVHSSFKERYRSKRSVHEK